jgi:hypothetical protein
MCALQQLASPHCTPLRLHTCRARLQHSRLHDHTHVVIRKRIRNAMADDACSGDCDEPVSTLKARLYDLKWHVPRFVQHVTCQLPLPTGRSNRTGAVTSLALRWHRVLGVCHLLRILHFTIHAACRPHALPCTATRIAMSQTNSSVLIALKLALCHVWKADCDLLQTMPTLSRLFVTACAHSWACTP